MGVLDLDSIGNGERKQWGRLRTERDKEHGKTTTTTFRSGHHGDDAASRSNTFAGTQAASLWPEPYNLVHRYRMGTGSLQTRSCNEPANTSLQTRACKEPASTSPQGACKESASTGSQGACKYELVRSLAGACKHEAASTSPPAGQGPSTRHGRPSRTR